MRDEQLDFGGEPRKIEGRPELRVIDEHGEFCRGCFEKDAEIAGLETEKRGWRTRFQNLKRRVDDEASASPLWPDACAVFDYWRTETGHSRCKFTPDRYYLLEPFLKEEGLDGCKRAVDGRLASDWHMKRGRHARRDGPIHDRLEQIFGSQESFEVATGVMDEREQPSLDAVPRTLPPRALVQALRDRVFLLELEERDERRRILLDEIGQLTRGELTW